MKELIKKVMVVVAHADDEVLGCGGTITKHVQSGDEVWIVVLADGVTSRYYDPNVSRDKELKKYQRAVSIRCSEFFRAAMIMGVKEQNCFWLNFPDQRLEAVPLLGIVKEIEKISAKISPNLIYTHHWGDLNKDHRVCYEATMTVFRPAKKINQNKLIYCFEISGNMNFLAPQSIYKFSPDYYVDISPFLQTKISAIRAYESEPLVYPNPLSPKMIVALSIMRAKKSNYRHVEAFEKVCYTKIGGK